MKSVATLVLSLAILGGAMATLQLNAAEEHTARTFEYVTIRWDGKNNTHLIRPGGKVEFIGPELQKASRPDKADDRSFYMNVAMNGLTKEGYEFAGMTDDEIIMKRVVN